MAHEWRHRARAGITVVALAIGIAWQGCSPGSDPITSEVETPSGTGGTSGQPTPSIGGTLALDAGTSTGGFPPGAEPVPADFTPALIGGYKLGDELTAVPKPSQGGTGRDACSSRITGLVRDFQESHPDMEFPKNQLDEGIVEPLLGPNSKPVYAGEHRNPTTTGEEYFVEWYDTIPGVNRAYLLTLHLEEAGHVFTFESDSFFPLDGAGFGNEGRTHNFHFTFEIHTDFTYQGGELFRFTGDDDVWVFVNGRLAVDLGGIHGAVEGAIDLDEMAEELEIELGQVYRLDMFHAERHTQRSNFRIDTTLRFVSCDDPIILY